MEISNGILFFSGQRENHVGYGISAWDLNVDPLHPAYCGYYGYSYWREVNYDLFIVDWPDVIIPGGKYGGVIARFDGETEVRDEQPALPDKKALLSSYPNPFNQNAVIRYTLAGPGDVSLSIYNLLGQQITTLIDSQHDAGEYSIVWDPSYFPSGIYFARLETDERSENIKMALIK